jgi:hypothetical protein
MLLPLLVLATAVPAAVAQLRRGEPVSMHVCRCLLAAGVTTLAAERLLRQPSYYQALLPLTAVLAALLLARAATGGSAASRALRSVVALGVLLVTMAAVVTTLDPDLFARGAGEELRRTYRQLLASPPIDAYEPAEDARRVDTGQWAELNDDARLAVLIRYLHDCTTDGDRVFVTGSTPYQVGYLTERRIAGGHLQWDHRWRSDPEGEAQSLALLERQSVPFAISTHDPVLDDLRAYPRIRDHFLRHYAVWEGAEGRLLIDRRRQPAQQFGRLALPCFR